MIYPDTRRDPVSDTHFDTVVPDPYRWLEQDVREAPEVADWVHAQDALARDYLQGLPGRDALRARLGALIDHERLTVPRKRAGRFFFTRNAGLENQAVLVVREADGTERVLIDPNDWAQDASHALGEWAPSEDGRYVAYAIQAAGADWRTFRVLSVDTGQTLDDQVEWARFTGITWKKDGAGFFYSRYPAEARSDAALSGHAVYFHALGAPQASDRLVYATPDQPHLVHVAQASDDGRYLFLYSSPGAGVSVPTVIDLATPDWTPRTLVQGFDVEWGIFGNVGTKIFLTTQQDAPLGKVVMLDLSAATPRFVDVVPEQPGALSGAWLLGGRLVVSYLHHATTQLRRFQEDGSADGDIDLPGIGSAGGFEGRWDDEEAFFVFTGHNAPTTIYRYDVADNTREVWAQPDVAIDLDRIRVEQRFYTSWDGTRVPMFVIRRADVTGPVPTLLYAYGGFGISMVPYYAPAQLAWVEQGGAYAIACIRGGGEYGKAWHDAGRKHQRQNAFDDFIAAAEYLVAAGISTPEGLAIHGESNGGLLVAAVVNQRPDLFAAAMPGVGVLDMLRFDRFTGGVLWINEFGSPANEADFRTLLAYSPYHTVRTGHAYPAVLVTTADTDERVVPAHSFKYAAALQAAKLGERPRLLRVDVRAGHGAGKPTDKAIEEVADLWAFAARWTGLRIQAEPTSPPR